jgi:hypothetical protein
VTVAVASAATPLTVAGRRHRSLTAASQNIDAACVKSTAM